MEANPQGFFLVYNVLNHGRDSVKGGSGKCKPVPAAPDPAAQADRSDARLDCSINYLP